MARFKLYKKKKKPFAELWRGQQVYDHSLLLSLLIQKVYVVIHCTSSYGTICQWTRSTCWRSALLIHFPFCLLHSAVRRSLVQYLIVGFHTRSIHTHERDTWHNYTDEYNYCCDNHLSNGREKTELNTVYPLTTEKYWNFGITISLGLWFSKLLTLGLTF